MKCRGFRYEIISVLELALFFKKNEVDESSILMDARVDRLHHLVYHRKLDEVVVPRAAVIANVVPPCCRVVFHLTIRFCFFLAGLYILKRMIGTMRS